MSTSPPGATPPEISLAFDPTLSCARRALRRKSTKPVRVGLRLAEALEVGLVPQLPGRDLRVAAQRGREEVLEGVGVRIGPKGRLSRSPTRACSRRSPISFRPWRSAAFTIESRRAPVTMSAVQRRAVGLDPGPGHVHPHPARAGGGDAVEYALAHLVVLELPGVQGDPSDLGRRLGVRGRRRKRRRAAAASRRRRAGGAPDSYRRTALSLDPGNSHLVYGVCGTVRRRKTD